MSRSASVATVATAVSAAVPTTVAAEVGATPSGMSKVRAARKEVVNRVGAADAGETR